MVAATGLDADGLDTALAVLGPREGMAVLAAFPGAQAAWVIERANGRPEVVRSPGWPAPHETTSPTGQ